MNQRELFTLLNASSDEDVLRHFPSHYESLRLTPLVQEPKNGQRFVFHGKPEYIRNFSSRGISLIRFKMRVASTLIDCMVYNQPFYIQKLSSQKELCFVLYYSENRKVYMVHSVLDMDSYYVLTGIKPVYNLPKGVSQSYFCNYVRKILSYPKEASHMLCKVPGSLVEKYRLCNEFDAYRFVHLPRNDHDLNEGLRVFKYEEALAYCVRSIVDHQRLDQLKKEKVRPIPHKEVNDFVKKLSYKLTKDQLSAIRDIVLDMEKEKVMNRLLQGDVGTGKTIVAFVALYANYLRGMQGVLMAPTSELATQHYENAKKTFAGTSIRIAFLSGSNGNSKETKKLLEQLKMGEIDLLISTHSAISARVEFDSLGLCIVDEQQLFGVEQREQLFKKGRCSDVLMMSATPIPRTLAQIINADVDVSTLREFPSGIRNVTTKVVRSMDPLIYKAIDKALEVHRQVFVVTPKIIDGEKGGKSVESVYQEIASRYPGKVQLLHGKIRKETQDEILSAFADNQKPILVSTTVIQVGIDVSSACLLIVYDANYFGVSTLHQLRGRVGRSGDFGLALLVYDGEDEDAKAKLDFLSHSNDGLAISQFDMRQRGTGSYGGTSQAGKSELQVCNFVDDLKMFECAKSDATEILSASSVKENADYLKSLDLDVKLNLY